VIEGEVAYDRKPEVWLLIRGRRGAEARIRATVDTGFDGTLTLPSATIRALGLRKATTVQSTFADGSQAETDVFYATVEWDGLSRATEVVATEGFPLVGMSLMYGYDLAIEAVDGGRVALTRRQGDAP